MTLLLNDFPLSIFLFAVYFCFVCCLFYGNTDQSQQDTEAKEDLNEIPTSSASTENEITSTPVSESLTEIPSPSNINEIKNDLTPSTSLTETTPTETEEQQKTQPVSTARNNHNQKAESSQLSSNQPNQVDRITLLAPEQLSSLRKIIDNLNFREIRKLCLPLEIQQKRNGVEKTKELLLAEIRRKCKDNPHLVITAIEEKLPEKIDYSSNREVV